MRLKFLHDLSIECRAAYAIYCRGKSCAGTFCCCHPNDRPPAAASWLHTPEVPELPRSPGLTSTEMADASALHTRFVGARRLERADDATAADSTASTLQRLAWGLETIHGHAFREVSDARKQTQYFSMLCCASLTTWHRQ